MANIVPVTISDALFYKTDPVFQYNEDQLLVIDGITLPASYRVDFSNHIDNYMAYTVTGDASGAVIPPEILANGNTIYAFYVDESGDTVTTQYRIEIPVIRRPMPEDYVPSPSSHGIINQLTQDVGDLKSDLGDLDDLETTDKSSIVAAINEVAQSGGSGALTQDTKQALLQCFAHTAWTDAHGQDYYDDLEDALYPFDLLSTISAVYTQSGTVYDTDSLDSLKADLVVTGTYSDGTYNTIRNYTLSGTLTVGTSTVKVTYGNKTTTFTVTVTQSAATLVSISVNYTQSGTVYENASLDSLKSDLVVTANWSDSTTTTVASADYTLSGTLAVGTSTITVSYEGKTATFNVTVSQAPATLTSISAAYTQSGTVYDSDFLDSLKTDLVVTAYYSDSTTETVPASDYTLSGTLTVGVSTITVSYTDKTATFNVTVTQNPEILISDYDAFVKGFVTYKNNTKTINNTYKKGAGALLIDVPLEEGYIITLPNYDNYKFSVSRPYSSGDPTYVIADSRQDYTLTAQDAEDAAAITVAHVNSDEMTAEEIVWISNNAKVIRV